jgi:hypothetical protein
MSIKDNIIEIKPLKIDLNGIFEKKIELSPLLEFTLLQRIIEELLNRQKETNDKIKELENKINFNQNLILPMTSNDIADEENIIKEEKETKENENNCDNNINKEENNKKEKTLLKINKNENRKANNVVPQILNKMRLIDFFSYNNNINIFHLYVELRYHMMNIPYNIGILNCTLDRRLKMSRYNND